MGDLVLYLIHQSADTWQINLTLSGFNEIIHLKSDKDWVVWDRIRRRHIRNYLDLQSLVTSPCLYQGPDYFCRLV